MNERKNEARGHWRESAAIYISSPVPMTTVNNGHGSLFDSLVTREAGTHKETRYRGTDTNLENDITSEISIVCLTDALLSLIKHGRLVSAAIDLPRP